MTTLHQFLDWNYGRQGDRTLRRRLKTGEDPNVREGGHSEAPLHVATRRRRKKAVEILLDFGAEIDARTSGGKTAYAHAVRRGFDEVAEVLRTRGASTELNPTDRLAVEVVDGRLDQAKSLLADHPELARTGNPEEDRLLADVAGRNRPAAVELLIDAGADLAVPGLDGGTPLHQAAWFGQPANARLLIAAGAPLDVFDPVYESSPIGWVAHGSRYSGGAEQRQEVYVELAILLLDAGSSLRYPDEPESDAYFERLLRDASPKVAEVLRSARSR